jgi:excinuclease UvrABC helicase subunit UvrB
MKNPIPHSGMFATKSIDDLIQEISTMSNKQERQLVMVYVMQMMNSCSQAVTDELNLTTA